MMAVNDKFDVWEAFQTVDTFRHGYITATDLKRFFAKNQIGAKEHEADLFVYEYSNPKGGRRLSFLDFLEIVLPRVYFNQDLRVQCAERKIYRRKDEPAVLNSLLEEQLVRLFEYELQYLTKIESHKIDLFNKYSLNFRDSFKIITQSEDIKFINSEM